MMIGETVRVAFSSIRDHKLRALLTMLGIIIGVGAVIAVVAIGTGAQRAIAARIEALGANLLSIYPGPVVHGRAGQRCPGEPHRQGCRGADGGREAAHRRRAGDAALPAGEVRQQELQHQHSRHHPELRRGAELPGHLRPDVHPGRRWGPPALRGARLRRPDDVQCESRGHHQPDHPDPGPAVRRDRRAQREGRPPARSRIPTSGS